MGAVVYRNEFFSESGTQWRVDIYDAESSVGSPSSFNTYGSGFTLTYQGTDNDVFTPIIPSEVKINCAVEDQSFMDVIDDIISSNEKRFFIYIYKGASFDYYWSGLILADLGKTIDESFPTEVELKAIDGIGFLKDFTYGNPSVDFETDFPFAIFDDKGYETILKHLSRVFNGIFVITGGTLVTNSILSTAVNFYEDNMYSGSPATSLDPLEKTQISHKAFIKFAKNVNEYNEGITYYDVLEQICLIFNARFFLSDGKWRLYNINQYTATSFSERTYDLSTSYPYEFGNKTTSALSINKAVNQSTVAALSYLNRSYYPDMINISREFDRVNSQNLIPVQENYSIDNNNQINAFGLNCPSGSVKLRIRGTGLLEHNNTGLTRSDIDFYMWSVLSINNNTESRWYSNDQEDNDQGTWVDSQNVTYFAINGIDIPSGYSSNEFSFDVLTDEIPISCDNLTFNLESVFLGPSMFNPMTEVTTSYSMSNMEISLEQNGVPIPDPISITYYAWNPNANENSIFVKVNSSLIGDAQNTNAFGRLKVENTGGNLVDSSSWKVNGAGTANEIIDTQISQIAKIRTTPTQKLNGSIKGDLSFYSRLVYDGTAWVMLGGSLNAKDEIWDGQWFELSEVASTPNLSNLDEKINKPPPIAIPSQLKNTIANVNKLSGYGKNYKATTTNNTKTETYIDGVSNKRALLGNNEIANFKAFAVGVITTGSNKGDVIALEQFGCLKNIDETIALVGTTSETKKADSGISGSVSLSIEPDSTNQAIKVSVVGEASESVEWKIGLNLTKVMFKDVYNFIYENGNNIITEDSNQLVSELNF